MSFKYLLAFFFCVFILICSMPASGADQTAGVIGISKIVAHPALDAVEKGIQDELKHLGYNFIYDLQNANGEISAAASIANNSNPKK